MGAAAPRVPSPAAVGESQDCGSVGTGGMRHVRMTLTTAERMRVMPRCEHCSRPVDEHDRQVRFRLPDPVLGLEEQDATPGTWKTADDPAEAVMQVPGLGAFVRALLPVSLTGGYTVTFGVWVGLHPDDLRRTFDVWWKPEYADLELDGFLANAIPVWGLPGAPVRLAVQDPNATPYCVGSADEHLARVLTESWEHEEILSRLP
jgi:hypothetical protein